MKTYEQYLKEAGNVHLLYYLEAADILNIKYEVIVKGLMARFEYGNKHWFIINTVTPLVPTPSTTICKRKQLTNLVLKRAGLPVPHQEVIESNIDAIKFFDRYKDIVIKPSQQLGGIGITMLPQDEAQVLKAFDHAFENSKVKSADKVLGETFIQGDNYRFLVLDNEVIAVVRRKAASIIGNSKNTIRELAIIKNEERKNSNLMPILIDNETTLKLQRNGLTLDSIPKDGKEIILRYNCNLTTGGTTEECMAEVHSHYKEIAVNATKAVDSKYAGVDIIAKDITTPSDCAINEINYNPGLRLHYKVDKGEIIKVAIPIMEYIRDKYIN